MKFEQVIDALRDGKRIFRTEGDVGLHFDPETRDVLESFCLEIWDIISDDWEIEE